MLEYVQMESQVLHTITLTSKFSASILARERKRSPAWVALERLVGKGRDAGQAEHSTTREHVVGSR